MFGFPLGWKGDRPGGAPQRADGRADEEPEDHKRLELYDLETHQKKLGPDYHRLKVVVKRSIEQEIRNKNFEARSGNFEKNRRQLQFPPRYG